MIANYGENGYVKLDQKQSGGQPAIVCKEKKEDLFILYENERWIFIENVLEV